jgi:hypothetical protein
MTAPATPVERRAVSAPVKLLGILVAGAAVAVALGVYGNEHSPTFSRPFDLFFSDTINLKVWFATVAAVLAVVQVLLALRIYGKVKWPRPAPPWLGDAHRLTGTLAFLFTLPVAFLCLWSLGFQDHTTRVAVHSTLGCFFYGAFVVKVLAVRVRGLPNWLLPLIGGLVFVALIGIWFTSAFWFFRHVGFPEF